MRVLVCGGRDYQDIATVLRVLDGLEPRPTLIIEGGSSGCDACAAEWAFRRGVRNVTFHADWKQHKRAAGPIRNQEMIDEGKPDLVVAFPGGVGTADMVRRAKAAGIRVIDESEARAKPGGDGGK
jgi:predicted Rossmann-fold nucleotide-binding protein